jgi:flagellar biosynthesis protein FliQ
MVYVNSVLIVAMVVLLLVAIFQLLIGGKGVKEHAGTLIGLIIWLMVVVAIGFQELPWLRVLVEPKS